MAVLGSFFTHYNYQLVDIIQLNEGNKITLSSKASDFRLQFEEGGEEVELPQHSPFASWKEARRFAGPLPFTFTYLPEKHQVLMIQGVRSNWTPKPVKVLSHHFSFLNQDPFQVGKLANAFMIRGIPYSWEKGKIDQWQP